jgi:hypothetical protein
MTTLTDTQVVTASGGLVELGYVQRTTNQSVTATSFAAASEVFATDLTFVSDGSPVVVDFYCPQAALGGSYIVFNLSNGSTTDMGQIAYAGSSTAVSTQYRYTPSAGSQTLNVRAWVQSGTGQVSAGVGGSGAYPPTTLRVSKIVQATQWPAVTTGTIICTSTTRPASPFEGQEIYETDTDSEQRWTGSAWSQIWPQLFVTASDTTTQTGAANSDFVYATATITLTPGVWLVQGSAVLFNTVTADAACVGLYNVTTAAEVTNSRGPNGTVTTGQALQLTSRLVQMSVSASTNVRVLCTRNGASTIRCGSASGAPAAALWAQKVG